MKPRRAIIDSVRESTRQLLVAILLTYCIGAPTVEMFDRWDRIQAGNDTETNLIIVGVCVGIGLLSVGALLRRVRPTLTSSRRLPMLRTFAHATELYLDLPIPNSSPPTTLRV